jgi:protein-S-isoprenylcysteine O-methyltransferase Ste14
MFPTFIFALSKKFRNTFSKVNSFGLDIIFEFLIGINYFFIVFIAFFISVSDNIFLIFFGSLIYLIGFIFTYIGYCDFYKNNGNLIENGIYHISRNPTYLFTFIAILGVVIISKSLILLLFLILQILFTHKIILNEEKSLEKEFGKEYIKYVNKTPRYFAFYIKNYRP